MYRPLERLLLDGALPAVQQDRLLLEIHGGVDLRLTGTTQTATGVAQTVPTEPQTPHTISFAVGNVVDPGGIFGTTSTVDVLVDGSLVLAATNRKGTGSSSAVWKTFSVTFVAAGGSTKIAFMNGDPSDDTNNGLDAVRVSSAP